MRKNKSIITVFYACCVAMAGCSHSLYKNTSYDVVKARVITDTVRWDTDDPAIWIHPTKRDESLVIGTDKETDGSLYAFDLHGKIVRRIGGLLRPNNVDIAYGFPFGGRLIDIAVVTEREAQRIRVFRLPDLEPLDAGDLIVFDGDKSRAPMGIALYGGRGDGALFAFVGGKSGPADGYLHQYRIVGDQDGTIGMEFVRAVGRYSGRKEIESIAVDSESGYLYYSDETVGVRKYHADPDVEDADKELALFATKGFKRDHEGISIYKTGDSTGYIIISDQQANNFHIYSREGSVGNPHDHRLLKIFHASTLESDGSEVTNVSLSPLFPSGLFVAMSTDKTFHYFSWDDIAGGDLKKFKEE